MVSAVRGENTSNHDLLEKVPAELLESLDQIDELLSEVDTLARLIGSPISQAHTDTTSNMLGSSRSHSQTTYTMVYIVKRSEGSTSE